MRIPGPNNPHVLVVEDEDLLRKILCQTIQRIGFVPVPCSDGASAFETLKRESVDVIVSDVVMPKMTGLELLQQAMAAGFLQPFIIISSQNKRDTVLQALKLGAFDFIDKPFQASVISQVMDEAYRYSQRLQQFAQDMKISEGLATEPSPASQMKAYYLLRLIEASVNPFGNTAPSTDALAKASSKETQEFFFSTALTALDSGDKRLAAMSKFETSSWDIGVILRTLHSIRMAAEDLLRPATVSLLETMESCYALLRLHRELLNKDLYAILVQAHETLQRAMAAEASHQELPETETALGELAKFETKFNKIIQSAPL